MKNSKAIATLSVASAIVSFAIGLPKFCRRDYEILRRHAAGAHAVSRVEPWFGAPEAPRLSAGVG